MSLQPNPWTTSSAYSSLVPLATHALSLSVLASTGAETPTLPTVILEAGAGDSSYGLIALARSISTFARVFTYDRSGLGLSAPFPNGIESTALQHVRALREALKVAEVEPPFVLCGHSYGGNLMRLFAEEFTMDVMALVLVDTIPVVPEKPVGRLLRMLLGGEEYFAAVDLTGKSKLTLEEQTREKEMNAVGEDGGAVLKEIRQIRVGVESLNQRQGVSFVDGKLVCARNALGSKRVCIVSGGLRHDFRKIYEYAVKKGNASEELREEMKAFLEKWNEERFEQLHKAMIGLSNNARYVQMEGSGRTHMLVQTVPDEIAEQVKWALGLV
jgi:pimeloyl-ACP methyl ester carboxylesterase